MADRPRLLDALVPWISYRQLDYWFRQGLLRGTANGSGSVRAIEPGEERVMVVMARLVRAGFPARLASAVARKACEMSETGPVRIRPNAGEEPGISIVITDLPESRMTCRDG